MGSDEELLDVNNAPAYVDDDAVVEGMNTKNSMVQFPVNVVDGNPVM
jgi:hypothetical protein